MYSTKDRRFGVCIDNRAELVDFDKWHQIIDIQMKWNEMKSIHPQVLSLVD